MSLHLLIDIVFSFQLNDSFFSPLINQILANCKDCQTAREECQKQYDVTSTLGEKDLDDHKGHHMYCDITIYINSVDEPQAEDKLPLAFKPRESVDYTVWCIGK